MRSPLSSPRTHLPFGNTLRIAKSSLPCRHQLPSPTRSTNCPLFIMPLSLHGQAPFPNLQLRSDSLQSNEVQPDIFLCRFIVLSVRAVQTVLLFGIFTGSLRLQYCNMLVGMIVYCCNELTYFYIMGSVCIRGCVGQTSIRTLPVLPLPPLT